METFILIHGAHHGSWCWKMVIPLLERAGYNVIAPDLPGHGENKKKAIEEITLNDYLGCIFEVLDTQSEPVIMVGHSMGGLVISQVAEYRPNKIKKLVYLCAVLLKNGESLYKEESPPPDPFSVTDAALKELFYGDCNDADFRWAKARLGTEPRLPIATPIHITDENYDRGFTSPASMTMLLTRLSRNRCISHNLASAL